MKEVRNKKKPDVVFSCPVEVQGQPGLLPMSCEEVHRQVRDVMRNVTRIEVFPVVCTSCDLCFPVLEGCSCSAGAATSGFQLSFF